MRKSSLLSFNSLLNFWQCSSELSAKMQVLKRCKKSKKALIPVI